MRHDRFQPKFRLGNIVATPAAIDAIQESGQTPAFFLDRHVRGDWGCVCRDDRHANDMALRRRTRLLSAYRTLRGRWVWVITEADRSCTTILLPSEY